MTTTDAPRRPGAVRPEGPLPESERGRTLPRASVRDTVQVVGRVLLPTLARGVIVRRPPMVRLAERMDADAVAVDVLRTMRRRYGPGPLRLRTGRRMVVLLDPRHVHDVLANTPAPFSPATAEKRRALRHFQPHGVLISTGADRADRRRYVEEVLEASNRVHHGAGPMVAAINDEVDALVRRARRDGVLAWEDYSRMWDRMVRRVVLGDGAADDDALTRDLVRLRATANWAFLHPQRRRLRARFLDRVAEHVARSESGSLAAWMARAVTTDRTQPVHQVPQWMFAFDAAAWASFRALAVLSTHPDQMALARTEVAGRDLTVPQDLRHLRACVLESLRLWPTTPAILRETTARTRFPGGPMPERTSVLIYAPLFHRDRDGVPHADRFVPERWADEDLERDWPLVPFSAGPGECPGRNLVLHCSSTVLARLVGDLALSGPPGRLRPGTDLPGTLDPFSLRMAAHEPA